MRSKLHRVFLLTVLLIAGLVSFVEAQTFEYNDGRRLQIEFVQEPPCPVRISVKGVDLTSDDPNRHSISLKIENQSGKAIRAYAMVSGGNRFPTVHTWTFGSEPFEAGKTVVRGVWPNSQDHYYFFFDYILYTDGSVCGLDNHKRSIQIKSYLDSRAKAMARLKELAVDLMLPEEIIGPLEKGSPGYMSHDSAGPPNPDKIKAMPHSAWEHVIIHLRQLKTRQKEAAELADKLEKELPPLSVGSKQ